MAAGRRAAPPAACWALRWVRSSLRFCMSRFDAAPAARGASSRAARGAIVRRPAHPPARRRWPPQERGKGARPPRPAPPAAGCSGQRRADVRGGDAAPRSRRLPPSSAGTRAVHGAARPPCAARAAAAAAMRGVRLCRASACAPRGAWRRTPAARGQGGLCAAGPGARGAIAAPEHPSPPRPAPSSQRCGQARRAPGRRAVRGAGGVRPGDAPPPTPPLPRRRSIACARRAARPAAAPPAASPRPARRPRIAFEPTNATSKHTARSRPWRAPTT
jgi:hypothetical protein